MSRRTCWKLLWDIYVDAKGLIHYLYSFIGCSYPGEGWTGGLHCKSKKSLTLFSIFKSCFQRQFRQPPADTSSLNSLTSISGIISNTQITAGMTVIFIFLQTSQFLLMLLLLLLLQLLNSDFWSWLSEPNLCPSFPWTDSGLCIYHGSLTSKFSRLHSSHCILFPTQSCLPFYAFWTNLLHSLIILPTVSSLFS